MQGLFIATVADTHKNSGLKKYNDAVEWARNELKNNPKTMKIYVSSLECTVERSSPPIVVIPYSPGNEVDPVAT